MDIVEFIEKVYKFPLMEWQKEFVRKAYEVVKNDEEMIYVPPRGSSSFQLRTLESLAILEVAQERGLVKLNLDKEDI